MNETCGLCRHYKPTKNKNVGTCEAPLPYHAYTEFNEWYVSTNDYSAAICAVFEPKHVVLTEDSVVYG